MLISYLFYLTILYVPANRSDMADCFSKVPESLIHHILSFLPFKEISRTCVLSKYFNTVWCNYPNLDFDLVNGDEEEEEEEEEAFFDGAENSFVRRPFIGQLRLCIMGKKANNLAPRLDRWILMSVEKNVSMLVLKFEKKSNFCYSVPQQVFVAPTLEILDLTYCTLDEDRIVRIELPRLEKLSLRSCNFVGNNLLQKILCASPKMKDISLSHCGGLGTCLSVLCPPLLKCFTLEFGNEFGRIEIDAPSLETFSYQSLNVACAVDLSSCTNLKELLMFNGVGTLLEHLPSIFLGIQVLKLSHCWSRKKYKISSQSLERLILDAPRKLNDVEIDAPNLKSLEFSLEYNMSSKLKFSSWRFPKADDIHMHFSAFSFGHAWRAELKDFLVKLPNYKDLKLFISDINNTNTNTNFIMIKELHHVSFSSLQKFAKQSGSIDILISSRDETNLVYDLSERYLRFGSPNILMICSSLKSAKSLCKKAWKWSIFQDKYSLSVELVSPAEIQLSSAWESFVKSNSRGIKTIICAYKGSTHIDKIDEENIYDAAAAAILL